MIETLALGLGLSCSYCGREIVMVMISGYHHAGPDT